MDQDPTKSNKISQYAEMGRTAFEDLVTATKMFASTFRQLRVNRREPQNWPITHHEYNSAIEGLVEADNKNRHDDLMVSMLKRSEIIRNIQEQVDIGESFGVVVIDLDNFKQVNDTFRHAMGDKVLRAFEQLLSKEFRRDNELKLSRVGKNGRLGGDEVVVTVSLFDIESGEVEGQMRIVPPEEQMKIAEDKIRSIGEKLLIKFPELREVGFGISLGGVIFDPETPPDAHMLLAQADEIAYRDKLTREYAWFKTLSADKQDKIRMLRREIRDSPVSDRRVAKTIAALDMFEPLPLKE